MSKPRHQWGELKDLEHLTQYQECNICKLIRFKVMRFWRYTNNPQFVEKRGLVEIVENPGCLKNKQTP